MHKLGVSRFLDLMFWGWFEVGADGLGIPVVPHNDSLVEYGPTEWMVAGLGHYVFGASPLSTPPPPVEVFGTNVTYLFILTFSFDPSFKIFTIRYNSVVIVFYSVFYSTIYLFIF